MSIKVENNLSKSENKKEFEKRVHYMPCLIEENGVAIVSKYFEPYVNEDRQDDRIALTGTFRGRSLDGIQMKLPDGYRAVILTEAMRPLNEDAERKFQVAGEFKHLNFWNWDKIPSNNDSFLRAIRWANIADVIHGD